MATKKIAVIGGGIFGLEIATTLKKAGHRLTLFEKENMLISKTSANNQNRLHLGLHYPRDLETARQSRIGFEHFITKYPSAVNRTFPNYYAISNNGSKTTTEGFVNFAKLADIPIDFTGLKEAQALGFNTGLIDSLWLCKEAVIDISKYRQLAVNAARSIGLDIKLATEILKANYDGTEWRLFSDEMSEGAFDFTIRATYGQDRVLINVHPIVDRLYEYQQTIVYQISSKAKSFGLTVVDGDYVTILPSGLSKDFLIYSPIPSVLNRYVGSSVPQSWTFSDSEKVDDGFSIISARAKKYAPILGDIQRKETLKAIRSIQPFASKTDQRISYFSNPYPNFFEIHSGKVDHAIGIAKSLETMFE